MPMKKHSAAFKRNVFNGLRSASGVSYRDWENTPPFASGNLSAENAAIQPGPINAPKGGIALDRYGRPEQVAAGDLVPGKPGRVYITGTTLDVDGGFNA
jgi:hypothetical protein